MRQTIMFILCCFVFTSYVGQASAQAQRKSAAPGVERPQVETRDTGKPKPPRRNHFVPFSYICIDIPYVRGNWIEEFTFRCATEKGTTPTLQIMYWKGQFVAYREEDDNLPGNEIERDVKMRLINLHMKIVVTQAVFAFITIKNANPDSKALFRVGGRSLVISTGGRINYVEYVDFIHGGL